MTTRTAPNPPVERLVLNIPDTQRALGGLSRRSVERAIERGDLDSVHLGGRRMVTVASINRWLTAAND